jgi:hypothetical protein
MSNSDKPQIPTSEPTRSPPGSWENMPHFITELRPFSIQNLIDRGMSFDPAQQEVIILDD